MTELPPCGQCVWFVEDTKKSDAGLCHYNAPRWLSDLVENDWAGVKRDSPGCSKFDLKIRRFKTGASE